MFHQMINHATYQFSQYSIISSILAVTSYHHHHLPHHHVHHVDLHAIDDDNGNDDGDGDDEHNK